MAYLLADSTGPLADFASIGGWADFRQWALKRRGPIASFAQRGYTEDLSKLQKALELAYSTPKVQEQYDTLLQWLSKAQDVLIVSDGTSDGEEREAASKSPIDKAAGLHEPRFEALFRYAFAATKRTVPKGRKPSVDRIVKELERQLEGLDLPKEFMKVVQTGGNVGLSMLPKARRSELYIAAGGLGYGFKFNTKSEHAVGWADKHSAELIMQITETTRERINNAIAEGLEEGDIKSAYEEILDAIGDPARAQLIAHHETMMAASFGQREGWRQATEDGLLPEDAKKTWIITPIDPCPICEELDGAVVGLDEAYPGEGGEGPPAHVGCRCTEGLVG